MDQLSPPDIQKLLGKWDRLPYLVSVPGETRSNKPDGTIRCADFFTEAANLTLKAHVIVGNPPWGPVKKNIPTTAAEAWCADRKLKHPNREKSIPFVWKAPTHLEDGGKVCFVLPHGTLFNHKRYSYSISGVRYSEPMRWIESLILTDYQFFSVRGITSAASSFGIAKRSRQIALTSIDYLGAEDRPGLSRRRKS
jgi:hypothetical protein